MTALADALATPIDDYAAAERFVLALVRDDPRPYEQRATIAGVAVRALLSRLGDPQHALRFVHVAGSKGKGSVALYAERLLLDAGVRVGTYTSPHLRRWNERFRVGGNPVDDAALVAALERLRPHVAALGAGDADAVPSFFDVLTAAGIVIFAEAGCDTIVLETGLGGLYDATNVLDPVACCITSIELEHTDKLGGTLAAIARHKAGIIKAGVPVVTGAMPAEASAVVAERAAALGARELRLGRDFLVEPRAPGGGRTHVRYRDATLERSFTLPHPSPHMAANAGLAVATLRAAGFAVEPAALERCTLPARMQVLGRTPWVVVDGAHTAASLAALGSALDTLGVARRRFVVSSTRGKAPDALAKLLRGAESVTVTRADPTRSSEAGALARALCATLPGVAVVTVDDPRAALSRAAAALPDDALLCVCGSIYLAGLALDVLSGEPSR